MSWISRLTLAAATGCALDTPGLVVDVAFVAPTTRTPVDGDGVAWTVEAARVGLASVSLTPCPDDPLAAGPDARAPVDATVDLLAGSPGASIAVPPGRWCAVRLEPRAIDACEPACAWRVRLGPAGGVRDVSGLRVEAPEVVLPTALDVDRARRYGSVDLAVDPAAWLDGVPTDATDDAVAGSLADRLLGSLVATPQESP